MSDQIPGAPWVLLGDAVAMISAPWAVRLLVHYRESPVGPYDEHALAKLTWRGPHVFQMSVNLEASRRGGREVWGFPKTLESLEWRESGSRIQFRRENTWFRVRAFGPCWNLSLPFWTAQQKPERWVFVPGKISGRAQLGWRGAQIVLVLHDFEMEIEKPR